jgi:diguanylate cyclase (GGDEF)-like protein
VLPDNERAGPAHFAVIERVLTDREPHVETVGQEGAEPDADFLRGHNLFAEILVPLTVQEVPIGILEVYWRERASLSADMVELCTAIAEQAAAATRNARLYAQVVQQAERDPVTGLLNHGAILARVDAAIAASDPFAFFILDVDRFKSFNDTHGHQVGDAVLQQVAGTLRETCRERDHAGRYGGDEFAIVLHGVGADEAVRIRDRLDASVRATPHVTETGATIPLSVSIGVACYPTDARDRKALIALADAAMYAVKRATHRPDRPLPL